MKKRKKRKCWECGEKGVVIDGLGTYEDTILVHCEECGMDTELEPDGLGEAGFELVEAFEIEMKNRQEEDSEGEENG